MFFVGKTVVNQPFGNGVSSHHSRKMVMTLMTDYWVVAGHSHFSIKNWKKWTSETVKRNQCRIVHRKNFKKTMVYGEYKCMYIYIYCI